MLLVKVADGYEGIGFVFENKAGHRKLGDYAMSIDGVEMITGLDSFISCRIGLRKMLNRNTIMRYGGFNE
ncbi:MAG: hypothetical protein J6U14_04400 [Bacteroidaceae bacterium]|nr:hypothetical protein [Bacteroidaceae bacterium]